MKELVEYLKNLGVLKTPTIINAFMANDREKYVPSEYLTDSYLDQPLPIGFGQTISQPYTVAFMIELLDPKPGQKILDIGFGSGWTAGILASIVGSKGKVYALEVVKEVYEFGKANLKKFDYRNIKLLLQSGWEGLPEIAPFDRILVSAAAPKVPQALKDQLKIGGRLVIPIGPGYGCTIKVFKKKGEQEFEEEEHPGFAFVPLVK